MHKVTTAMLPFVRFLTEITAYMLSTHLSVVGTNRPEKVPHRFNLGSTNAVLLARETIIVVEQLTKSL